MTQDQASYRACPKPSHAKKAKVKVSNETKIDVYTRDNGCCVVCGKSVNPGHNPHHILYKSEQGGDDIDNQVTLGEAPLDQCNCHNMIHSGVMNTVIDRFIAFHGLKKTIQYLLKGTITI